MWFPLESNPAVMNRYMSNLGLTEAKVEFVDVYGVSDDLLEMVPSPVHALLLVYPLCEATEKRLAEYQAAQTEEVAVLRKAHPFFFTRQLVPNACGTIGIVHALINNREKLGQIAAGSILDIGLAQAAGLSEDPTVIGKFIAQDVNLASAHAAAAQEGVTANQPSDAVINLHFVCFIHVSDRCVELDGRKANPTLHGHCTDNRSFLKAAAAAIKERIELNPTSYEFGITALVDK
ncbi:ubiquitin carboxyl-terminal hydrolase, putative [Leishmania tarentolae]|uniref:Ubiquitin carboxyl-terminal hydrolase n=1 Tax=Leishmania tarentolae TaxID=5689 RepID=A0A640KNT5_LEITA|nr:ubiquitin carboxyl-terminal hydrolase, putative [Leishmania tarentolae]